jgi:hypothetical protein
MDVFHSIVWDKETVKELILEYGREYVRIKTPRGMRTSVKRFFDNKPLEGNCFRNSLVMAARTPDHYYYNEGLVVAGNRLTRKLELMPHAWLSLKQYPLPCDADWALDVTWKDDKNINRGYFGIRFDPKFAVDTYLELRKHYEKQNVVPLGGMSLLSHPEILMGSYKGFGEKYAF